MNLTLIILCLLVTGALAQNSSSIDGASTTLLLEVSYTFNLKPNAPTSWQLTIPQQYNQEGDLYIIIQSPPDDPLQQPQISITTESQPLTECTNDNSEYSAVCRINSDQLTAGQLVTLQSQCVVNCQLKVIAIIQSQLTIHLDSRLEASSPQNGPGQFEFKMQIPEGFQFTDLAFYAQLGDLDKVSQGIQLYANIGDENATVPSDVDYQVIGEPIYWGGLGLFFNTDDFLEGRWIKIYMSMGASMKATLYWQYSTGNTFNINLGTAYFDYTTKQSAKGYNLNLANSTALPGSTIYLFFVIYSGIPDIRLSLNSNFSSVIKQSNNYGTITFMITEQMRKNMNFDGTVYIIVSSPYNADFYFNSWLDSSKYVSLDLDIAYYNEITQGEVENYFFEDFIDINSSNPLTSTNITYVIKVDMIMGTGIFGVRRCRQYQESKGVEPCLFQSTKDMNDQSKMVGFKEIPVTIKQSDHFYQIIFTYDVSLCDSYKISNSMVTTYYCSFHILAADVQAPELKYSLSLAKRTYNARLKEGVLVKDAIFQKQTLYYRYGLTSLDSVQEILFYATVMEGSIFMMASTDDPYPSFESTSLIKSSSNGRISFKADSLKNQFYLAIVAQQFSQYTIGVVVTRTNSDYTAKNETNTTKSKIQLQLGITQQYTLSSQEQEAWFTITSYEDKNNITIEVVELVGTVKMEVTKQNGSPADCLSQSGSSTAVACDLQLQKSNIINIKIKGTSSSQQRFAISYYKTQTCQTYSLNLPLYKELPANSDDCVSFSVTKLVDLSLTTSAPIDVILNKHFSIQLCVNSKCLDSAILHHYLIDKEILNTYCELTGTQKKTCLIKVAFINNSTSSLNFDVILQQKGLNVALFDGIPQKVISQDLSTNVPKQLYFEVYSQNSLRVFFTSLTAETYVILGHFVQEQIFLANKTDSIYLKYDKDKIFNGSNKNYYVFTKYGAGSGLFVIPASQIKQLCKSCVFTLAVYSIYRSSSHSESIFQVEVSQQETAISISQSKIGYLEEDDIYVYQLDQPIISDAVVTVRDKGKQSAKQTNCFRISKTGKDDFAEEDVLVVPKGSTQLTLYIIGVSPVCSFEVTYSSTSASIISAVQNTLYSFEVDHQEKTYFLYDHTASSPFKIVRLLSTGSTKISIAPITDTILSELLQKDPSTFVLTFNDTEGEVYVSEESSGYCVDCSYLIAITSTKGAKGQLVVLGVDAPVPLSVNGIVKQKINVSLANKSRRYSFNSIVDFNISITMIYGKIKITVTDPDNKFVYNKTISSSTTIQVQHSQNLQDFSFEYDSALTRYGISIQADIDSSYSIKASKINISERLFEGISTSINLEKNEPYVLEFTNLYGTSNNATLNILLEIITDSLASAVIPKINVTAQVSTKQHKSSKLDITSRKESDTSINIQLPQLKGDYYITINSDQKTKISAILVKQALMHLKPEQYMLMTKPHTYQLYSPAKSVLLQVFTCTGELSIDATEVYKDLEKDTQGWGEIILEENNYGGHYVVSSSTVFGEYFVRVNNKAANPDTQLQYMLYYYYYEQSQQQPYKMVGLRSIQITYTLGKNQVLFTIEPVFTKIPTNSKVKQLQIRYVFYISPSKYQIRKYANCRLSGPNLAEKEATYIDSTKVQFSLNPKEFEDMGDLYFIGAQAIVSVVLKDGADTEHYPKELNLIYSVTEMSYPRLPPSTPSDDNYSVQQVILFMLLPFAIAGVALYCAIRFCLRKYRGMVPDNFVEEAGQSQEVVQYK